jgi:hypothetical protein
MEAPAKPLCYRERAAALIIVLAFVVLLSGLMLAYLSRTTTDRQVSHGSLNQSKADQLAASAMETIIGDLRQEIINGSTAAIVNGSTIYIPTSSANMLPMCSPTPTPGTTPAIPNLIRRSAWSDQPKWPDLAAGPALGSRASAVNSTANISANGRSITSTRWNSHYLVPKKYTLTDDFVPIDAFSAVTPDWVYVTNNGAGVITQPTVSVLGRYAYAIYDEGGLLDLNVAGYPTGTTVTQAGRKGSLAFADLTALPYPIPNPNSDTPPIYQIDRLVGWRNYATTQPTPGAFPVSSPANKAFAYNFQQGPTPATNFYKLVANNTNGFLNARSDVTYNERTDQMFLSRQQLIAFRKTTQFSPNALQYLTHFSREAEANTPQWSPAAPDSTNPSFQTLVVTAQFTRNDGTTATVGEPLVKKRFLLQRLNWLTYKGPSASRASGDPDIVILTGTYGAPLTFLQQGTASNILKYFGLAWDSTNERWNYVGHSGSSSLAGSIPTLDSLANSREPDFFELLQAGIFNGSLGDSSGTPGVPPTPTPSPTPTPTPTPSPTPTPNPALPIVHQQSKMLQVLTIGANLITQARTDTYPTRIAFSNGGTTMEAIGSPRLPYLNALAACPVGTTGASGGIHWFLVPNLWDAFRNNWDLTETTASTPLYPRPPVRIRVTGSAAFGSVAALPTPTPPTTGRSVNSANVTPFPTTTLTFTDLTLTLKTGATTGNAFGRDGLREASRMSTSDISSTLTAFTTTTSPNTATALWSNIARPPRPDNSVPGTTNFIVFRLSLPGASIPATATNPPQNPVLILNPGFQMTLDYQSPNGTWYPYSYLQGNSASSTWISANLNLTTTVSQYGLNPGPPAGTSPTLLTSGAATIWNMTTLAQAPMLAKADPRSIRHNSQIGVVNLPSASPSPTPSAGIIDSIWPSAYPTVPLMSPDFNPANYCQTTGDNAAAGSGSNPYSELSTKGDPVRPIIMNRPFRSVGEMAYAFRDQPFKTLNFSSTNSPDAGLLDLFSVSDYSDPSGMRAGVINLNTRQGPAITAVLNNTIGAEGIQGAAAPSPVPITNVSATNAGNSLASLTKGAPLINKAAITSLIANQTGLDATIPKTQREAIARALGEVDQTRTWNLMIDVIAQSGRYKPNAGSLQNDFIVQGEQHYWVNVAIDRFTGQVIDKQIEVVNE